MGISRVIVRNVLPVIIKACGCVSSLLTVTLGERSVICRTGSVSFSGDGYRGEAIMFSPNQVPVGEPTMYKDIVFRDGEYIPIGIDPYFDASMGTRIKWLTDTNGGKNIPPGDKSYSARKAMALGLPPKYDASVTATAFKTDSNSVDSNSVGSARSQFVWLGDPSNMEYTGRGDTNQCSSCGLSVSDFVPGDTLLNQHAFFTKGECPYLKANYTPDRLKIEIGQERFRRGSVAHPNVITVPDAWNDSTVALTNRIYVTLAEGQWCYMCGRSPGAHGPHCYQKMTELKRRLKESLLDLKL